MAGRKYEYYTMTAMRSP